MANPAAHHPIRTGFTLIELLVVITIMTVMISMLVPSLSKARSQAKKALCLGNLRQHMSAVHTYSADYRNYLIPQTHRSNAGNFHNWGLILSTYMGEPYGPLSAWNSVDISNGATAKRGTAFICPAEEYVNGVRIDIPSAVPQAAGAIGYGDGGTVIPWKYYFTTYALNLYASRRRTTTDTTQAINYQTYNQGAGNDLRRLDSKRFPSDLWFITEGYPVGTAGVVTATALTRSKSYAKMNFDRHPDFAANIGYLDGHSATYVLDSMPADVGDPNDSPLGEAQVKSYKHWGTNDDSSTGW
jgi:prepilin-type N-terminal cleavage/methylation domain-containing protein/prepilin-type processing-associated H-X9-DG protein